MRRVERTTSRRRRRLSSRRNSTAHRASTTTAVTPRRQSSEQPSTLTQQTTPPGLETISSSPHQSQGGSGGWVTAHRSGVRCQHSIESSQEDSMAVSAYRTTTGRAQNVHDGDLTEGGDVARRCTAGFRVVWYASSRLSAAMCHDFVTATDTSRTAFSEVRCPAADREEDAVEYAVNVIIEGCDSGNMTPYSVPPFELPSIANG